MYLRIVTLLNCVTDMDYRRCNRPASLGQGFGLEGRSASTAAACMVHRLRGRSWAACAFLIFSAVLGSQVVISVASRERRNPAAVKWPDAKQARRSNAVPVIVIRA
jgi:hypothetical protein